MLVAAFFLQAGAVGAVLRCWPRSSASCRAARRRCPGRCSASSSRAGKEAEYFGFYEISDRGTSWLGPLAFGLTYQLTGSYRLRDRQPGHLLRRRASSRWPRCRCAGPSSRPATPHRSACDQPELRARPHRPAAGAGVRPGLRATGGGTRRRRTCGSSTARWTAGSRPWPCRSTTTSSRQGRHGLLVTQGDRSAAPQISSRVGLSPRGGRDRRRHRPAAAGPRPVGRRAAGRLPDRRRGAVPHRRPGRPARRARRRVARRRLRVRADHRLPHPAVPGHPAAAGGRRRRPAGPGGGALLVRPARAAQRPRRRRRDGALRARPSSSPTPRRPSCPGRGPAPPPPSATRCSAGGTTSAGELGPTPAGPGQLALP